MLRYMLYQLLSEISDLLSFIVTFCSLLRDSIMASKFTWTVTRLEAALLGCKSHRGAGFRNCFFIDALDEHEGDRKEMGEFLRKLASSDLDSSDASIKVCVANRPLN